ncbi:MAG TPA: RsmG family class I SAM-dependent methyltransferase [Candidatus Binataceae bacterium]|nr:RsmG family class I SAM-dependent methyltransferase [Candidatus Binataceae bacterium]
MKPCGAPDEPRAIGRAVRELVEKRLAEYRFVPPDARLGERIEKFAAAIALWGARMNLTARPGDASEIAFHIVDSLMPLVIGQRGEAPIIGEAFAQGRRVLDLGAGAGFPGLVLAAAAPADFVLAEARRKRASFLTVTAGEMGLRNVAVEAVRGDSAKFAASFDTVIARALGRPAEFYRMAAAALKAEGVAILFANPGQRLELEAARACGMSECERREYALGRAGREVKRILAVWRRN